MESSRKQRPRILQEQLPGSNNRSTYMKSIACVCDIIESQKLTVENAAIFSHLRQDNKIIEKGIIAALIKRQTTYQKLQEVFLK